MARKSVEFDRPDAAKWLRYLINFETWEAEPHIAAVVLLLGLAITVSVLYTATALVLNQFAEPPNNPVIDDVKRYAASEYYELAETVATIERLKSDIDEARLDASRRKAEVKRRKGEVNETSKVYSRALYDYNAETIQSNLQARIERTTSQHNDLVTDYNERNSRAILFVEANVPAGKPVLPQRCDPILFAD